MPKSDRSLLAAAIFGLTTITFGAGLALGGDWTNKPYEQTKKPYASAEAYREAQGTGAFAAYPTEESNRCYNAKNHDTADLCAQWRAAIAAEKAANAAIWSNRLSIVGAVLSAIGLAAILITLRQGRKALKRASAANKIARDAAKRQLRAYISVKKVEISSLNTPEDKISINFELTNTGQTPANRMTFLWAWRIYDDTVRLVDIELRLKSYDTTDRFTTSFGPHENKIIPSSIEIEESWRRKVISKELTFFIFGEIKYSDAFGDKHTTKFIRTYTDALPNRLAQWREGNEIG